MPLNPDDFDFSDLYTTAIYRNPPRLGDGSLRGVSDNDVITGDARDDNISLGDGNDIGFGGDGNDTIRGGWGNDVLAGGRGDDTLYGTGEAGSGIPDSDVYVFASGDGNDTIKDWARADRIDLRLVDGVAYPDELTITSVGGDTLIAADDITIRVEGQQPGVFSASSFLFAPSDRPNAVGDTLASQPEDSPARTITFASLLANDTDPKGQGLTVTGVYNAFGGTVEIAEGAIRFSATPDFSGRAGFDYAVSDGQGGSDIARASFTVSAVQDNPVAVDDRLPDVAENAAPWIISLKALTRNDFDPDGGGLQIGGFANVVGGSIKFQAVPTKDPNSFFSAWVFTPEPDFHGPASFDYILYDFFGNKDVGHATFDVTALNEAPVATDDTLSTQTGHPAPRTIAFAELTANDTDGDGDPLTVSEVGGATGGTVAIQDGAVVFTAAAGFNGTAGFDYTVDDGKGGRDVGHIGFEVATGNTAPVAADDRAGPLVEDGPQVPVALGRLLANDSDADGDTLTVTQVDNAVGGTIELHDGAVFFTSSADFSGTAGFDYTVEDGHGGSDVGRVSLEVMPTPDAPVAVDDWAGPIPEDGSPFPISLSRLLGNDRDADGDTLTVTSVDHAVGGTIEMRDGALIFTPNADFNGTAGFDYTVSDGHDGSDVGHVSLDVLPVNDAPVAVDDVLDPVLADRGAREITFAELTGNDRDPDGDTLSLTSVSGAVGGTVGIADGRVVFAATAGFDGTAGFDYRIEDGKGGSDTGSVQLDVTPGTDVPDPATLSISARDATKAEGNAGTTDLTFVVTRSGDIGSAAAATWAVTGDVDGADFADGVLPAGRVGFEVGETAKTITLGVAGDALLERDEALTITLSAPANGAQLGTASASGAILNDDVEIIGTNGNDALLGTAAADVMRGMRGKDELRGLQGNDALYGDDGFDELFGMSGFDKLYGGTGGDRFTLLKVADAGAGFGRYDEIMDFSRVDGDKLNLRLLDANSGTSGTNENFRFMGTQALTGPGQVRYEATDDGDFLVTGSVDADSAAEFAIIVRTDLTELRTSDFIL